MKIWEVFKKEYREETKRRELAKKLLPKMKLKTGEFDEEKLLESANGSSSSAKSIKSH